MLISIVFGEEEEIMGYKDLSVDIWLSAGTYQAWFVSLWQARRACMQHWQQHAEDLWSDYMTMLDTVSQTHSLHA